MKHLNFLQLYKTKSEEKESILPFIFPSNSERLSLKCVCWAVGGVGVGTVSMWLHSEPLHFGKSESLLPAELCKCCSVAALEPQCVDCIISPDSR